MDENMLPYNTHKPTPLYKEWRGRNSFFFCGNCVTGPCRGGNSTGVCFAYFLIAMTMSCYIIFLGPNIALKVSVIPPAITMILFGTTIGLFLLTQCTDPGILPRKKMILAGVTNLDSATILKLIPEEDF